MSGFSTLGNASMAAGMVPSPTSPYLIGAGAVLSTLGGVADRNQKEREMAYNMALDKYKADQERINSEAKMASNALSNIQGMWEQGLA